MHVLCVSYLYFSAYLYSIHTHIIHIFTFYRKINISKNYQSIIVKLLRFDYKDNKLKKKYVIIRYKLCYNMLNVIYFYKNCKIIKILKKIFSSI